MGAAAPEVHAKPGHDACFCAPDQAFYLPWGEELARWALTHPEYTRDQVMMLVVCIAEANGLKRKERNALLGQIEAELSDLRAVP